MEKTQALSLRVQPNVKRELDKAAKADSRSTASLVKKLIAEFLKKQEARK
jgi:predicted transcriptional regulator